MASSTVALQVTILNEDIVDIDTVPWSSGMNAQAALEAAYNTHADPFDFSIAYYGTGLGYLVEEFDGIGDQPQVFWLFMVNGKVSPVGIDQTILNAGDKVSFTYSYYSNGAAVEPQQAAKHRRFVEGARGRA